MSLQITRLKDTGQKFVIAEQRLCLTVDGKLVDESDPRARWLFCVPGRAILASDALKYGLLEPEPEVKVQLPVVERPAVPVEAVDSDAKGHAEDPEVKDKNPAETKDMTPKGKKKR
jgi:hypothetical protein